MKGNELPNELPTELYCSGGLLAAIRLKRRSKWKRGGQDISSRVEALWGEFSNRR